MPLCERCSVCPALIEVCWDKSGQVQAAGGRSATSSGSHLRCLNVLLAAGAQLLSWGAQCTYTCCMSSKDERLHLRVDPEQKALLEAASRAAGDTVSGFVLRAATEAAADVLADRRVFVLDEQAWRVFDLALSRPAAEVPGLRELLSAPTVLDQGATEPPAQAGR
jgi:uncharacterized protein (DUF1778 family)